MPLEPYMSSGRFHANCSPNDPCDEHFDPGSDMDHASRTPIDPVDSKVDHVLPGLGVDKDTGRTGRAPDPDLLLSVGF